jgi:hypothetical protein
VIWGKHDLSFDLGEPERYRKDVPANSRSRRQPLRTRHQSR